MKDKAGTKSMKIARDRNTWKKLEEAYVAVYTQSLRRRRRKKELGRNHLGMLYRIVISRRVHSKAYTTIAKAKVVREITEIFIFFMSVFQMLFRKKFVTLYVHYK